jgi:TatD DNase family protein
LIDLHCHLDLFRDPAAILEEVEAKGVFVLAVTTTPKAWRGNQRLMAERSRIHVALGLHPELVAERHSELALWETLLKETKFVGEIGLDGSPEFRGSWELQKATLARMLNACAHTGGKIISLHSRRAASAVLDAIETERGAGVPILHWFSGSKKELDRAVGLGCWFSVGPAMLRSEAGRKLAAVMPRDRVLTETDAPFAQINGRPLMPWEVVSIHPVLAQLWRCSENDVSQRLQGNLCRLMSHA